MPYPTANYTGTHAWDINAVANYVLGQHGTASPASNPEFLRIGGRYLETPGSATGTLDNILWVDERGYLKPHFDTITLFSTTTAGTQTTSTGTTTQGLGAMRHAMVLVDITGTGGTDPTLDCYIDSQFGGTKFINVARSTLMVGTAAYLIQLSRGTSTSVAAAEGDLAANGNRQGFGDNIRVRYSIGSNATSQVTFAVYLSAVG